MWPLRPRRGRREAPQSFRSRSCGTGALARASYRTNPVCGTCPGGGAWTPGMLADGGVAGRGLSVYGWATANGGRSSVRNCNPCGTKTCAQVFLNTGPVANAFHWRNNHQEAVGCQLACVIDSSRCSRSCRSRSARSLLRNRCRRSSTSSRKRSPPNGPPPHAAPRSASRATGPTSARGGAHWSCHGMPPTVASRSSPSRPCGSTSARDHCA